MQENQEIIEKKLSNKKSIISTQLRLKRSYENPVININVLQNNRIGIIFYDSLIIYSLYTFLEISQIIPLLLKNKKGNEGETQEAYSLKNFVELKNKDLVLWTLKIIFFYTLSGKNYKLYQAIHESNLIEYFYFDDIIEMENGNLIISSYKGIKLYTKTKDQYIFNYFYSFEYYIEKVLKIKSNRIIIFQIKQEIFDFLCADSFYKISIFNISNKSEKTLNTIKHHDLADTFKFLIKGYNLFAIYTYGLEIYDLKRKEKFFIEFMMSTSGTAAEEAEVGEEIT